MTRPETLTARRLRSEMPAAERILWSKLRRAALGHRFRRQHPIGPYVVDFASVTVRVVVEVDGDSHYVDEAARRYDDERAAFIEGNGWRVVRVTNVEVRDELDAVCLAIREACDERAAART